MMMRDKWEVTRFGVALVATVLVACSSTGTPEVPAPDGAAPAVADAAPASDAAAPSSCDALIAKAEVEEAIVSKDPATNTAVWIVRAREGKTNVTLTIRESAGAKAGAGAGTFGEEQLRPPTAPVAVLVQTDCNVHGDHVHCGASMVPESGAWTVRALEGRRGGTFDVEVDAKLVEAKLTSTTAKPVAGGKSACVSGFRLTGTLKAQ